MPKVSVITLPGDVVNQTHETRPIRVVSFVVWNRWLRQAAGWLKTLIYRDNIPFVILAFLLSRIAIMDELAPFGLAFFAAVAYASRPRAAVTGLWALAGVLSTAVYSEAILYATVFILYFRWGDTWSQQYRHRFVIPLIISGSILTGGIILAVVSQSGLYQLMLAVFEAILCLIASAIFILGTPLLLEKQEEKAAETSALRTICFVALLVLAINGFGNISILGYSIRSIMGYGLIMAMALTGGTGAGAASGVAIGIVAALMEGMAGPMVILPAVAGMAAGLFRDLGKAGVVIGFISGTVIAISFAGQTDIMGIKITEASVAAIIFCAIPRTWMNTWQRQDTSVLVRTIAEARIQQAATKMKKIEGIFGDVAAAFNSLENRIAENSRQDNLSRKLAEISERVCERCTERTRCWDVDFFRTYQAMMEAITLAEHHNTKINALPGILQENCIQTQTMLDVLYSVISYDRHLDFWKRKVAEQQRVTGEQLQAAGAIIGELADEIAKNEDNQKGLALKIRDKASELDCSVDNVKITGTKREISAISLYKQACGGNHECANTLVPLVAGLANAKMLLEAECGSKEGCRACKISLKPVEKIRISSSGSSIAKVTGKCGDTYSTLTFAHGKTALLLSDGMGSGELAANESHRAVKFLESLLEVGFTTNVTVKVVNSLLLLRAAEESFATVDMAVIDTHASEVEFFKIGSAPSFIKRVREVTPIESGALPVGILQQVEIQPIKVALSAGDVIVMVSDGVADIAYRGMMSKESWLVNFLRRTNSNNPKELTELILNEALRLSGGVVKDDMTVLVTQILARPNLSQ